MLFKSLYLAAAGVAAATIVGGQVIPAREGAASSLAGERNMQAKSVYWGNQKEAGLLPKPDMVSLSNAPQACDNGTVTLDLGNGAEDFPCSEIDFESFISLQDLNITNECFDQGSCDGPEYPGTTQSSDIWGWLSPEGREITIHCVDNGVWFVDGTDPANPIRLGFIRSDRPQYAWCDVKVYQDIAYIVKDGIDTPNTFKNGIQVFDLKQLICASAYTDGIPVEFQPQFVYREHGSSHNVVINTETGFLYSVGTSRYGVCAGGLHIINLNDDPLEPKFETCIDSDGYTHDAQCVVYDGPDADYQGEEICFAFNEDTMTIWDVTDKSNVQLISRATYVGAEYIHQGWLTADMRHVLIDDELDERDLGLNFTHTFVFDVSDLDNPVQRPTFIHSDDSIDHNLYVWGAIHAKGWGGNPAMNNAPDDKYAYLSNYVAGIRVLDMSNIETGMTEVGFFDIAPDKTGTIFEGTWSNYMHPSGTLAVSSIDRGLFFLKPKMAYSGAAPTPSITPAVSCPTPYPTSSPVEATSAPTSECEDEVPSPLSYGDGTPALCVDIFGFCTADGSLGDRVRAGCPKTCDSCPTDAPTNAPTEAPFCADYADPGINLASGEKAVCSQISAYCEKNPVVRDRCSVTCGSCNKLADLFTLPKDPSDAEDQDTVAFASEALLYAAVISAAIIVAVSVFVTFTQAKTYKALLAMGYGNDHYLMSKA